MEKYQFRFETESFYLGAILNEPSLLAEATLTENDINDERNRNLFKLIKRMSEEGEEPSLVNILMSKDSDLDKVGGLAHVQQVSNSVPSVNDFKNYEYKIKQFNAVEKARQMVKQFINSTNEANDSKELSKLIQEVNKIENQTVKRQPTFKELLTSRMEDHYSSPKEGMSGIDTGYKALNRYTDGWQKSDLIIIAARPSLGKTALVLNSLLKSSKKNVMGTFFSIEMAKGLVVDRLIATEGNINLMKMRNPNKTFVGDDWGKYSNAVGTLEKLALDIRDENTVPEIRAAIRKNLRDHPDKEHVIAIDFLTLVKPLQSSGNTHVDITEVIRDLKDVAKELNVPIIVIAQLNRGVEGRQDKRPSMADIAESGSIEQIADLIAFLYRDDYYDKETENKNIVEVIISKNRNGMIGVAELLFIKETNTYLDIERRN